ncbi:DUF2933 domain-containing protein [Streptomyces iakyrus]|uniref:DUF2933 domain-containing protein n=1 Tax=Streptomyces iakyrus TaxID=68219 RepID=UPI00068D5558|nr:DUF2933 domain-containing protein [Streptomyces iakyrus]
MCLNKKAIIGLGAVAAAVLLVKPGWFLAALPLLVLALCPLSMIFMMRGMNSGGQGKTKAGSSCGTGTTTPRAGTPSVSDTDLNKQISAIQAELRDLKAAQARQEGVTTAGAEEAVKFTKDTGSDAHT